MTVWCYPFAAMVANLNPKLTAFEAQAAANGFLLDNLPDHYLAIEPRLEPTQQVWRVSVVLTYPYIGSIGEVGEIRVSAFSKQIISFTPLNEIRTRGRQLYEQHHAAIEAAFLSARNA
jgi:hypothetical protein